MVSLLKKLLPFNFNKGSSFIFILIIFIGCGSEQKQPQENIENFELIHLNSFSITPPDSVIFGRFSGRAVVNNSGDRIAFYDQVKQNMIVSDTLGNVIYIIGSKGRGPDEFENIFSYNFDEHDNLIVYDTNLQLFKIFDKNGEYLKSFSAEGERREHYIVDSILYPSEGYIYMGAIDINLVPFRDDTKPFWESYLLVKYDYEGNLLGHLAQYDNDLSKRRYYSYTPVFYLDGTKNRLFSTHMHYYGIQEFDLEQDSLISKFGAISDNYNIVNESNVDYIKLMNKEKRREFSTKQTYSMSLHASDEYIFVELQNLQLSWYNAFEKTFKDYYLTVYDRETKQFLSEISLPYMLTTMHNNTVFLIENDNPENYQIGIYSVENIKS